MRIGIIPALFHCLYRVDSEIGPNRHYAADACTGAGPERDWRSRAEAPRGE